MLTPVETFNCVEAGSFREIPFETIGPTVIFAAQNAGRTALFLNDWVRTVPADIVKAVDLAAAVTDEEKGIIGVCERDKLPRLGEP